MLFGNSSYSLTGHLTRNTLIGHLIEYTLRPLYELEYTPGLLYCAVTDLPLHSIYMHPWSGKLVTILSEL